MKRLIVGCLLATTLQAAADQRGTLQYGGLLRSYYVHFPPGYDGVHQLPLLVLLHGGAGSASQAMKSYRVDELTDREKVILVAPNGTGRSSRELLLTWNVEWGFGYAQRQGVDDTGFVRALVLDLEGKLAIDPKRVYLTGISNGGVLCHWTAARYPELFAGIAPVAAAVAGRDEGEQKMHVPPRPAHPVTVVMFNGLLDEHMPPRGGLQTKSLGAPKYVGSNAESARFWVEADGCNPTPVVEELPAQKATRTTWSGGRNGTKVVLYSLHNQGHAWPGGLHLRMPADAPSQLLNAGTEMGKYFRFR